MIFTEPLLDPPAPAWKRDLPKPDQAPSTTPYPPVMPSPPNHVDPIYLELPRSALRIRGLGAWLAIAILGLSFLLLTAPLIFPPAP